MSAPSRLYRFMAEFRDYCRSRTAQEFPPAQRHTCRAIIDHMDSNTLNCFVSNRRIAEITGQGENTVRGHITEIVRHGIITKTQGRAGKGLANRYHGNLGFTDIRSATDHLGQSKTVDGRPFTETAKRSVGASKTVGDRPRTAENKAPTPAAALTAAPPTALRSEPCTDEERIGVAILRLYDDCVSHAETDVIREHPEWDDFAIINALSKLARTGRVNKCEIVRSGRLVPAFSVT